MDDDHILIKFHEAYPFFHADTLAEIASHGEVIQIKKKDAFIRRDKVDKRIGFVIKGLFKGTLFENDEEQTLWFSNELDILASYMSILQGKPSKLTYTALEDSEVFVIEYPVIRSLAANSLQLSNSLISMQEQLLMESFLRLEKFVLYSAEDRYLKLLNEKPEILTRIPQKLLASYIGITPVSLSRLRRRLAKR